MSKSKTMKIVVTLYGYLEPFEESKVVGSIVKAIGKPGSLHFKVEGPFHSVKSVKE